MNEEKTYRFPGSKQRKTRKQWLNDGSQEQQQPELAQPTEKTLTVQPVES